MTDVDQVRERLAQMRALSEAATPGPWEIKDMGDSTFTSENCKGWWWVWKAGVRHYAGVMEATGDSPDKPIGVAGITDGFHSETSIPQPAYSLDAEDQAKVDRARSRRRKVPR